jgi:hypothetical protein
MRDDYSGDSMGDPGDSDDGLSDVFLCCSPRDIEHANGIHDYLTSLGITCFCPTRLLALNWDASRVGNTIDRNLEAAVHLIVVASRPENITGEFMEHQWGVFVHEKMKKRKAGNSISVLAEGMAPGDLPTGLRLFEMVHLSRSDALERIGSLVSFGLTRRIRPPRQPSLSQRISREVGSKYRSCVAAFGLLNSLLFRSVHWVSNRGPSVSSRKLTSRRMYAALGLLIAAATVSAIVVLNRRGPDPEQPPPPVFKPDRYGVIEVAWDRVRAIAFDTKRGKGAIDITGDAILQPEEPVQAAPRLILAQGGFTKESSKTIAEAAAASANWLAQQGVLAPQIRLVLRSDVETLAKIGDLNADEALKGLEAEIVAAANLPPKSLERIQPKEEAEILYSAVVSPEEKALGQATVIHIGTGGIRAASFRPANNLPFCLTDHVPGTIASFQEWQRKQGRVGDKANFRLNITNKLHKQVKGCEALLEPERVYLTGEIVLAACQFGHKVATGDRVQLRSCKKSIEDFEKMMANGQAPFAALQKAMDAPDFQRLRNAFAAEAELLAACEVLLSCESEFELSNREVYFVKADVAWLRAYLAKRL